MKKRIRLIWDYLTKSREEFIKRHKTEARGNWVVSLYGDNEIGYELRANKGLACSLTMPRQYYLPLNQYEAVKVIFGGWRAAQKIFYQRLGK